MLQQKKCILRTLPNYAEKASQEWEDGTAAHSGVVTEERGLRKSSIERQGELEGKKHCNSTQSPRGLSWPDDEIDTPSIHRERARHCQREKERERTREGEGSTCPPHRLPS